MYDNNLYHMLGRGLCRNSADWVKFGLTALGGVAVFAVGLAQYVTTSAFSVRQPFLELQSRLCNSAAEHAARLASTCELSTWQKSREEFWMLYWGPLAIVEDVESKSNRVEAAMVKFGDILKTIDAVSPPLPIRSLEQPALEISHACRDLLASKWNAGIMKWFWQS